MDDLIGPRLGILRSAFSHPRTLELLDRTIRETRSKGEEFGFEIYIDYSTGEISHSRFIEGEEDSFGIEEARAESPLESDVLVTLHSHSPPRVVLQDRQYIIEARDIVAKVGGDITFGDLVSAINDSEPVHYERECSPLYKDRIAILPISVRVYPTTVNHAFLHLFQVTRLVQHPKFENEEDNATSVMREMERREELDQVSINYIVRGKHPYHNLTQNLQRFCENA